MKPQPMTAERLDRMREMVDCLLPDAAATEPGVEITTTPSVPTSMVRDLLADRDHHAARADDAEREIQRLRARIEVTEEDVDEADIGDVTVCEDSPKVIAWMHANGFEFVDFGDPNHRRAGIWRGDFLVRESSPMADERVINDLASAVGRPPLDVLDEIAAMEVDE